MLTITLSANPDTGDVIDFEQGYERFFEDFAPYAFPIFNPEEGETTQVVHLESPEAGEEADARAVLIEGHDFLYTFSNHSVSGTIETVRLTTLGAAYNTETEALNLEGGIVTAATPIITIEGLNIVNPEGVLGEVHAVIRGMMGGGPDGLLADPDPLSEHLWAEGHRLQGSSGDDRYRGTDFSDVVKGFAGNDTLGGGKGSDKLYGGNGRDELDGGATNDSVWGGNGNDTLSGGNGKDRLYAGSGNDTVSGDNGADRLFGGSGADSLHGGAGNDSLWGNNGGDSMLGGNGKDQLFGGNGNDTIRGGKGVDTLTGDGGRDTFVFNSVAEAKGDRITDFEGRDQIDLSSIDANANARGNQAFDFIGDAAFSGTAGELRAFGKGADTIVMGDTDGDGKADFRLELSDFLGLASGDFLL